MVFVSWPLDILSAVVILFYCLTGTFKASLSVLHSSRTNISVQPVLPAPKHNHLTPVYDAATSMLYFL